MDHLNPKQHEYREMVKLEAEKRRRVELKFEKQNKDEENEIQIGSKFEKEKLEEEIMTNLDEEHEKNGMTEKRESNFGHKAFSIDENLNEEKDPKDEQLEKNAVSLEEKEEDEINEAILELDDMKGFENREWNIEHKSSVKSEQDIQQADTTLENVKSRILSSFNYLIESFWPRKPEKEL